MLDCLEPPLLGFQPGLGKQCLGYGWDPNLCLGSRLELRNSALVVAGTLIRVLAVS